MSLLEHLRPKRRAWPPEDSITLRLAATGAVCTGIAACAAKGELSPALAAATGSLVVAGNVVSHLCRRRSLPLLKFALGAAMVAAFTWFFFAVATGTRNGSFFSVEQPLAALFALMQSAHSFDVPSRRDLGFSLAGSATLIAIASAQAVDLTFGLFVLAWAAFGLMGLAATWSSMAGGAHLRLRWLLPPVAATAVIAAVLLALLPAPRSPSSAASALFGAGAPLAEPSHLVQPSAAAGHQRGATGAAGVGGYLGFAGALDTALRPSLGSQVVLRVRADRPSYWLAETFDTWSGRSWSETGPSLQHRTSRASRPTSPTDGPGTTVRDAHARSAARGSSSPTSATWRMLEGGSPFLVDPASVGAPLQDQHEDGKQPSLGTSGRVPGTTPDYQTFYVATPGDDLVLHASAASVVWFPSRQLDVSSDGTIQSPEALGPGSAYSVLSTVATPTPAQLSRSNGTAGLPPATLASSLELPHAYRRVGALARRITSAKTTVYAKVGALEEWIGKHTVYTTHIPPLSRTQDTVVQFLFGTRRGYCEQISTSLAVMLRTLGIPAREAVGYVPGKYNPITGLYDEEAKDAHAWVQVWFPGYGWQSFDPTAFVPLANPSPGVTLAQDIVRTLGRIPPIPVAPIAGAVLLAVLALWWRRRRPASWRAAVTRELEHAARRAGVATAASDTLGTVAARVDAALDDARARGHGVHGTGSARRPVSAIAVADAAARAAWRAADPDRATARRHVRHARRVRRAARAGARARARARAAHR